MLNDEPGHGFSPESSAAISHLMFRPAEPDELGRAASLCQPDAVRQGEGAMQCFVAVRSLPVERLMAVVFWKTIPETDQTLMAEFTWKALPALGEEVTAFLRAFIAHVLHEQPTVAALRVAEWQPANHATAATLESVGFSISPSRTVYYATAADWRTALEEHPDTLGTKAVVPPQPGHFHALSRLLCGPCLPHHELAHAFQTAASATPSLFDPRCSGVLLDALGSPVAACFANASHGHLTLAALVGNEEQCRTLLRHCLAAHDPLPAPDTVSFSVDDAAPAAALLRLLETLPHQTVGRYARFSRAMSD
jgi:hypothetical protein